MVCRKNVSEMTINETVENLSFMLKQKELLKENPDTLKRVRENYLSHIKHLETLGYDSMARFYTRQW